MRHDSSILGAHVEDGFVDEDHGAAALRRIHGFIPPARKRQFALVLLLMLAPRTAARAGRIVERRVASPKGA